MVRKLIARKDCVRHEELRGHGSLEGRENRIRELGLMNEHNMYELVKNADARGGFRVHAKWLQGHKIAEVRCLLVATQRAINESGM